MYRGCSSQVGYHSRQADIAFLLVILRVYHPWASVTDSLDGTKAGCGFSGKIDSLIRRQKRALVRILALITAWLDSLANKAEAWRTSP
jgi:hypothetical protein